MHRQLPGWRSLISSVVGRVYANVLKSKRDFPWLAPPHANAHCEFSTNILLMERLCVSFHIALELPLFSVFIFALYYYFFIYLFHFFALDKPLVSRKNKYVSFRGSGLTDLLKKKKKKKVGNICDGQRGCCEAVWHRHWLSLLRSNGIVGFSWKREEKGKQKKREKNE